MISKSFSLFSLRQAVLLPLFSVQLIEPTLGFILIPRLPSRLFSRNQNSTDSVETINIEEDNFIRDNLMRKPLFSDLSSENLSDLIQAFREGKITYPTETTIVQQGDSPIGDYVYMIAEGDCTVFVDGRQVPKPYGTIGQGEIFGDMAVLYNETRSASIVTESETVTLFRVHSEPFQQILSTTTKDTDLMQEIDQVINQVAGSITLYSGNIIPPYKPERVWLWRRWSGTILNVSYSAILLNMFLSLLFVMYADYVIKGDGAWTLQIPLDATAPDKHHPLVEQLSLIRDIWNYLQGLATFVLTFYLNRAYTFWRGIYDCGRGIQGRMNDHGLLLATNVMRNSDGSLTEESKNLLEDIGQYTRLLHALLWAAVAHRFDVLQTREGLNRMATRGLIRPRQLEVLQKLLATNKLPEFKLYYAPLEWIMVRTHEAMDQGILRDDTSTKGLLLQQMTKIRGSHGDIMDQLDARMPLAYSHLVQLLVDTFVFIAPFALYSNLGDYSIFAVGILTLFYTGLLNLAKIFLDPLNNEEFCENSIFMDLGVFIRESNANTLYWQYSGEEMPFDSEGKEIPFDSESEN